VRREGGRERQREVGGEREREKEIIASLRMLK
jgi:hypothetical protein